MEKLKNVIITISTAMLTVVITHLCATGVITKHPNVFILLIILTILFTLYWLKPTCVYISAKLKKTYSEFIYDEMNTTLEFLDIEGNRVSHDIFTKISNLSLWMRKKRKEIPFGIFTEEGRIVAPRGNCINAHLTKKENNNLEFNIKFTPQNVYKNQSFYAISSEFIDVFNKPKMNFWDIPPKYFCKTYRLQIIIPDSNYDISCEILKSKKSLCKTPSDYNGSSIDWTIDDTINYLTTTRYGKKVANIVIHNIKNTEAYRIRWELIKN
nr:hypothetical protein [uncultured Carboxylicivirga sp.]